MPRFPTPTEPGHYWAKLVHPSRMPEGEDWASADWEIVQVNVNCIDPDDPEHLSVSVPGVGPVQWIVDFVWGPAVPLPAVLGTGQGKAIETVTWRSTGASPGGGINLSFHRPDRSVLRIALARGDALTVADTIDDYLSRTNSHSDSSSGSPTSDGSKPSDGQEMCPPTRSSSAEVGE